MSGWTVDTLKEYSDKRLDDYKHHVSDTFAERDKAITEFKFQTDAKFASRNEIQTAMKEAALSSERATSKLTATFISRSEAYVVIALCCTITGTIVGVVTFFMRK